VSIDLVCHLNYDLVEAAEMLKKILVEHTDLFNKKFLIYGPRESGEIPKEIAAEFNFDSRCRFSVALNVKDESIRLKEVANLMRSTFGEDRILVLFNGETPY
jgi:hypothetical protein